MGNGHYHDEDYLFVPAHFKNTMRAAPTAEVTTGGSYWRAEGGDNSSGDTFDNIDGVAHATNKCAMFYTDGDNVSIPGNNVRANNTFKLRSNNASARLALVADL